MIERDRKTQNTHDHEQTWEHKDFGCAVKDSENKWWWRVVLGSLTSNKDT
jgi:hypothetical protein